MRRTLKTTNATPQKYSGEGVSTSRRSTFRRNESPPHSAINTYVRNDIEKITKASVISLKIAVDKSIVKRRLRALLKRHLVNFVLRQPHRVFSTSARHRSAALLKLRKLGCLTICKNSSIKVAQPEI